MKNRVVVRMVCVYLILTLIFISLSVAQALIPNSLVENNISFSLDVLEMEGTYPTYFWNTSVTRADNFTDRLMVKGCIGQTDSVLKNAVLIGGRIQYWQGYNVFFKPLFIFFQIYQIRYIMYFLFFILFILCIIVINNVIDRKTAVSFGIAIVSANILLCSVVMQFFGVFVVTFISVLVLLSKNKCWTHEMICTFFMTVGAFTSYFDFLTAPLISLGIPLALYIIYNIYYTESFCIKKGLWYIVSDSIMWGIGYFLTFFIKWIFACVILHENVFMSSLNKGLVRVNDSQKVDINRFKMLILNIKGIMGFDNYNFRYIKIAIIVIVCLIILLLFVMRKTIRKHYYLLLIPATYPYFWYLVFANHSQIHFWFTYRTQTITVFVFAFLVVSLFEKMILLYKEKSNSDKLNISKSQE